MIFPELPKRMNFEQADTVKTPLHSVEVEQTQGRITVEEWWIKHGLATDPAALPSRSREEPIDWLAKDAWEFYALCAAMLGWIVYWRGIHIGAW